MDFKKLGGLNVLVTGHTGFKGSWLSIWLNYLGANVIGYSLDPPTNPNNFQLSRLEKKIIDIRGDIRDYEKLTRVIKKYKPELIFHLAAQPIVSMSYKNPQETFSVNSLGTVNVLEAVRKTDHVKALVCITSDKCYEKNGSGRRYKEDDRLGGDDPYSASKAMAELAIHSYRKSFPEFFSKTNIASARAGNVIGGGDFAPDRLIPDCVRAFSNSLPLLLRTPRSVRPWQFVLEPISGYLNLAVKLMEDKGNFSEAWNFGPTEGEVDCEEVVKRFINLWGRGTYNILSGNINSGEKDLLKLNSNKASISLNWNPKYNLGETLRQTAEWYKKWAENRNKCGTDMYEHCINQIDKYVSESKETI